MEILQIPAFTDNYFWILYSEENRKATVIDPGDSKPIINALSENNLDLSNILITHHHADHIGGVNDLIKEYPEVEVFGPSDDRIPKTKIVNDKDNLYLENIKTHFQVLDVAGHTKSHIAYYTKEKLFCGDTLFSCGCGRLFEGTPKQMHKALSKIMRLPNETLVYCAHEYTLDNIGFAKLVEPDNEDLLNREKEVTKLIEQNKFSIPCLLGVEKKTNPFLRFDYPSVKSSVENHYNINIDNATDVFMYTRKWKDEEYD